jgi:hypothetical protein
LAFSQETLAHVILMAFHRLGRISSSSSIIRKNDF